MPKARTKKVPIAIPSKERRPMGRPAKMKYPVARLRVLTEQRTVTERRGNQPVTYPMTKHKMGRAVSINLRQKSVGGDGTITSEWQTFFIRRGQRTDRNDATNAGFTSDDVFMALTDHWAFRTKRFTLDAIGVEEEKLDEQLREQLLEELSKPTETDMAAARISGDAGFLRPFGHAPVEEQHKYFPPIEENAETEIEIAAPVAV